MARRQQPLELLGKDLSAEGITAHVLTADLSHTDAVPALAERIRARVGTITSTTLPSGCSGTNCAVLAAVRAARFRAAFSSRSRTIPQAWQAKVLAERGSLVFAVPHSEQVLLEASSRVDSALRTVPITGSWIRRRSAPSPNAPVLNRHEGRERRFDVNRGIRDRPALRLAKALARFAHPLA